VGQQALGVPGQDSSVTGLSGATANDTSDNVETSSKRSLTGRRRGASTGSKRSNRQVAGESEKQARPGSAGRAQAGSEPRPKKRGGFLSFLGCCGGSNDTEEPGSRESTQPAKTPTTASQPSKLKTQQQQQVAPNASATNTSADGSKEVIDEKVGQEPNHTESSAAAPILPTPPVESEKPPPVIMQPDNPVPSIPQGIAPVQPNAEASSLPAEKRDIQSETPVTGPPHIDTAQRSVAHDVQPNHTSNPVVSVIAPTPVVSQQEDVVEDAIIQDRTPEQAARDTDIEMTDVGPSLPLSTSDVPQSPDVETSTRERSSSSSSRIDLPPPPPLAERQLQNQHSDAGVIAGAGAGAGVLAAGAGVAAHQASQDPSAVSTPEPVQKWLLPPITSQFSGKKCLVLDLDETLVHSSFKVSTLVHNVLRDSY
jgi:RNA polymerase II subunit A small phosphatase-like protein